MKIRKKLLCLVAALVFWICAIDAGFAGEPGLKFTDVPEGLVYYPFVKYLADKGVIAGFPDGTFRPQESLTRAEAAKMLVLAAGITGVSSSQQYFADVDPGYWAYGVIQSSVESGLLKGYPDGTYQPEQPVSRSEVAALLLRLSNAPQVKVGLPKLVDMDLTHWAADPVAVALKAGLLGLSGHAAFAPEEPVTRSDMARGLALTQTLSPNLRKAQLVGKLAVKKDGVFLLSKDTQARRSVSGEVLLSVGDTIIVDKNGTAEIIFEDGSGIKIDSNTELEIKKLDGYTFLRTDGTSGSAVDRLEIKLNKGVIHGALSSRYEGKKEKIASVIPVQSQESEFPGESGGKTVPPVLLAYQGAGLGDIDSNLYAAGEPEEQAVSAEETPWWQEPNEQRTRVVVDMPWGVAGIRGTFWTNWVTSESQGTNVLVGHAVVNVGGRQVVVDLGMSFKITDPQKPPQSATKMTEAEKKAWAEVKPWVQERVETILRELTQNLSANPQLTLPPEKQAQQTAEEQSARIEQFYREELNAVMIDTVNQFNDVFKESVLSFTISIEGTTGLQSSLTGIQDTQPNFVITDTPPATGGAPGSGNGTPGGGGSSGGGGSGADTTAPTVTGVSPGSGETGVAVTSSVTATFSEEVRGVSSSTFTLQRQSDGSPVAANVSYDSNSRKTTLIPVENLAADTQYTATLAGGITDLANNALSGAPYAWSFTTVGSSATTPVLSFNPASVSALAGGTFSVDIVAENVQDLYGVDLEVLFDPTRVEVLDVVSGSEWREKAFANNQYDNIQGKVSLIMTRKKPAGGLNGTIILATVSFKALSPGSLQLLYASQHDLCNTSPALIANQIKVCNIVIDR